MVECFTAMWVQVSSKSWWIGWMFYSYMGSNPHQVTVDWFKALQLCGFKSPSRCAELVVCFTAMWLQVLSKSHWIGWMLYSYVGSSALKVTLDWLNDLQLRGFKSPPSHAGLVECFTAMWVQVLSKSRWIGWMLYSYVGLSPLQVTLDWLNALQLHGLKSPPSHGGLVECFTAMWVQVPFKLCWIGWMLYSYVGSSPLQVTLDWLNALQLCGFKTSPSYVGLVECFTAMWVQDPSKSWWIGWMLYRHMGASRAGMVECFTATWVQVPFKLCWIGGMLYSYVGSSPLQVTLDWLNALQLCGFKCPASHTGLVECFTFRWVQVPSKSQWIVWMLNSCVGSSPLQVTLDWLNALQLCGFKSPPSHTGLVECFTSTWVQVPSKSRWIGWMLYSYVGSSPLQVTLDWLNALQLHGFKCPSSCAGLVECFTAMWVHVLSKSHWIG